MYEDKIGMELPIFSRYIYKEFVVWITVIFR